MSDEELLLQKFALGENGAELRLHNEFCEQLIKFGINATYVQGFKESFDFEKLDLTSVVKNMDEVEQEENQSMLFMLKVEYEELQAEIESGKLSENEIREKEKQLLEVDTQIRELESIMSEEKSSDALSNNIDSKKTKRKDD